MFYDTLNTEEQVSYLIKPIIEVLQEAGGQLEEQKLGIELVKKTRRLLNLNKSYIHLIKPVLNIRNLILSLILLLKS